MNHDFAKQPKATPKNKKVRKSQVPGWVWLFIGIVTGVFISFLGYLADITPDTAAQQTAAKANKTKPAAKQTTTTQFDFYTLLPGKEVIVPMEREEPSSEPSETTVYILQAGSFKTTGEADRLRAKLILLGLDARVEEVSVAGGDLWHRVQVGPFNDLSTLTSARSTLADQGIETLLLKRPAEG
jgi:cell division protein FtsN